MLVGIDEADQHGVDHHVVGRALVGQHLGERHPGRPSNRRRRTAPARRLGTDIEHVDDTAPAPLLHLRPNQSDESDRRKQLLVEILLQDLIGELLERSGAGSAGVVDDDIDLAERLRRLAVCPLDLARKRDVGLDADDLSAGLRCDRLDCPVERFAPARHDGNVGAGGGKAGGHRKPDAFASPGNHGCPPAEADLHRFPSTSSDRKAHCRPESVGARNRSR
jgi:hypothetical protein